MPNREQLEDVLITLYQKRRPDLPVYPWEHEAERWGEMVKCMLVAAGLEPRVARIASETFGRLEIDSPEALASADQDRQTFLQHALTSLGADSETSRRAVLAIVAFARVAQKSWGGHVQVFLREQGRRTAETLSSLFEDQGINPRMAKKAAVLWLQNVANAPLLLDDDPYVMEFCARNKTNLMELIEAADKLDLNVAVLDDLLAVDAEEGLKEEEASAPAGAHR